MAKSPSNRGKQWAPADVSQLKQRAKASENDVSLKPTNQSPYNRRKP